MANYTEMADKIITAIGGKENVQGVTHCATRLRFSLVDESQANDQAVSEVKGVIKLIKASGQYQVVIGNYVADVYSCVREQLGLSADSASEEKAAEKKQGVGAIVLSYLTSCMGPALNLICAGGIIKGVLALLSMTGILTEGMTLYALWNAAGDAIYYFMPIVIGYNICSKLKMNGLVGLVMGAALVYPSIQNMAGATFLGMDVGNISYTTTVFPIILVMLAAAPLDHFLKKILPQAVSSFMEPALLLMVMVPLGYLVIGPIANMLSNGFGALIDATYGISPILCGILLCGLWQVLVLFGIHMGLAAVIFTGMFVVGYSALYPMTCIPCFAQFSICLAIYLRTKDQSLKAVALPAALSAAFGTTEPAIYGVTLPRIKYFVMSCVISAAAGAYMGLTNVFAYQLGGNGFLCLTIVMNDQDPSSLMNFAIAIAFTAIVSFVATLLLFRDEKVPAGK